VLRGGAFHNNERNTRCANRNRNNPHNRNNNIGFRVLVAAHFTPERAARRKCRLATGWATVHSAALRDADAKALREGPAKSLAEVADLRVRRLGRI